MLHSEQKAYVHIQSKTKYAANISISPRDIAMKIINFTNISLNMSFTSHILEIYLAFLLTCKHNTAVTAHFILLVTKKLMVLPFVVDCTHTE